MSSFSNPNSIYTKETYQSFRSAFCKSFPLDSVIGMISPYTGKKILTTDDYELYCLSFYLKSSSEDELERLKTQSNTLSTANDQLQAEISSLSARLSKTVRRFRVTTICFSLFSAALLFYLFSQLCSRVIPPIFWLYFFVLLIIPIIFLFVLIPYRKKSLTNQYTSVVVALFVFIAVIIFSFARHFFV